MWVELLRQLGLLIVLAVAALYYFSETWIRARAIYGSYRIEKVEKGTTEGDQPKRARKGNL